MTPKWLAKLFVLAGIKKNNDTSVEISIDDLAASTIKISTANFFGLGTKTPTHKFHVADTNGLLKFSGFSASASLLSGSSLSARPIDSSLVAGNSGVTKTFTPTVFGIGYILMIGDSGGTLGIYVVDWLGTTITAIKAHPAVELSSTPSANRLGLFKGASTFQISITQNGVGFSFGGYLLSSIGV